jgi:hypothetical protein
MIIGLKGVIYKIENYGAYGDQNERYTQKRD